jgi:hypothetical protein
MYPSGIANLALEVGLTLKSIECYISLKLIEVPNTIGFNTASLSFRKNLRETLRAT